jgi:hypothetical protein
MKRTISVLVPLAISLGIAACSTPGSPSASHPPEAPVTSPSAVPVPEASPSADATVAPTAATNPSGQPEPPSTEPTTPGIEYRVTYDWGVPSNQVTIPHTVHAPIAPAPALPLPYLVAIYAGDHPEADPKYQRISFYFRGAFPEYKFRYVPALTAEGSGETIPLEGNSFLQVWFVSAQAHDNAGESTVKVMPANPIGFQNLKSYGTGGDFEGHVTYGLGLQVAPDSDQVLAIRAGELRKPDGVGGFYYIVHLDVMSG